jgi:seryl-tRNA synthetase
VEVPQLNIPYDPELYQLNNKLCKLRIKAEDRLGRIIELAREDSRIRRKLEEAIERFQKARIEANEKIGRVGAMKAQKRLQEQKQREANKVKFLELGENENLVHASHLYALLTLPEIKSNRLII